METMEIKYLFDGYGVAFKIIFTSDCGKKSVYTSPFVFESTDDAYHGAINELSN
jgi:hypothetical protein